MSTGAGLHIIMNQNVNVSVELARVLYNSRPNPSISDKNWLPAGDGTFGMNIGLNYIF